MSILSYCRRLSRERLLRGDIPEWMRKHSRGQYIFAATLSFVGWSNMDELKELKKLRDLLTEHTGEPYVLAHIIPLNHPMVCGLSVPENIKVIPARVNAAEGNWWMPDQMEMF